MRVKRFTSETIQGAVGLVKAEFGDDALIIETRRVRRRGLFRWFRPAHYEVLAALDGASRRTEESAGRETSETQASVVVPPTGEPLPAYRASVGPKRPLSMHDAADGGHPSQLFARLLAHLQAQDVYEPFAREVVHEVRVRAETQAKELDWEWVVRTAALCMSERLRCVSSDRIAETGGVIPLIGPTGVGKTTTIAKLAANFALLAHRRVAVITTDTYRIAAVDQLRTYTDLIGVPLDVVYTPEQLSDCVKRHADKELIFIDTAGRSQHQGEQLRELASFMEVLDNPLTHLVVSATTKVDDTIEVARNFEQVGYKRIIVSKVDETRSFGTLYTLGVATRRELAYLTIGQGVPDDIEVADAEQIVELIMEGARGDGSGPAA